MTIEILQEITEWADKSFNSNNGIYWVDKKSGNLIAYKHPNGEKKTFKTPMKKFSKSRRKFKKLGVE